MKKLLCLMCIFLSGCAWINSTPKIEPYHISRKSSVKYSVTAEHYFWGDKTYSNIEGIKMMGRDHFESAALRSGNFSQVSEDLTKYDYDVRLNIYVNNRDSYAAWGIQGLFLTVVPTWNTQDYKVTAQVYDAGGRYIGKVESEGNTYLIRQLIMALAYPFARPVPQESKMAEALSLDIVYKISRLINEK